MKSFKLVLILSVLVFTILGVLIIFGFINEDLALGTAAKAISLVLLICISGALVMRLARGPSISSDQTQNVSKQDGPQF